MKNIIVLLFPLICFSQINLDKPEGWYDYSNGNEEFINRINVLGKELTDQIIENSDLKEKDFSELIYYTKYDLYEHNSDSTIPAIRVSLLKNYMNLSMVELRDYYAGDVALKSLEMTPGISNASAESMILKPNLNSELLVVSREFDFLNPRLNFIEKHKSEQYLYFISKSYYVLIFLNDTEADNYDFLSVQNNIFNNVRKLNPSIIVQNNNNVDKPNFIIQFIKNGGWIIFLVVLWRLLKSNKSS